MAVPQSQTVDMDISQGIYSYEDAVEAFKDYPFIEVIRDPLPEGHAKVKRGIQFKWHLKMTLTRTQLRAIIWGSGGAAAATASILSGGTGTVVAAAVGGVLASLASDALTCERYTVTVNLLMRPMNIECADLPGESPAVSGSGAGAASGSGTTWCPAAGDCVSHGS